MWPYGAVFMTVMVAVIVTVVIPDASPPAFATVAVGAIAIGVACAMRIQRRRGLRGSAAPPERG